MQSIVFFCSEALEPYEDLYDCAVVIFADVGESQGLCFCADNRIYFEVCIPQIVTATNMKLTFGDVQKSLLFTLLHEIGHGIDLLSKSHRTGISLPEIADRTNARIRELRAKYEAEQPGISPPTLSRRIPEEVYADRFAYRNLSYLMTLYEFQGILV